MKKYLGIFFLALALTACQKKSSGIEPTATAFLQKTEQGSFMFDIQPWPAKVGDATLAVRVTDKQGKPVNDASVTVALSMPSMAMDGPKVALNPTGNGTYTGKSKFSMAAAWSAEVDVELSNHQPEKQKFNFNVAY